MQSLDIATEEVVNVGVHQWFPCLNNLLDRSGYEKDIRTYSYSGLAVLLLHGISVKWYLPHHHCHCLGAVQLPVFPHR